MKTNIRDYPLFYWIIALTFDILFNVTTVLISFYSFYKERGNFFGERNFRNDAIDLWEKEKLKNKKINEFKTIQIEEKKIETKAKNSENIENQIQSIHNKYSYQNYLKSHSAVNNINSQITNIIDHENFNSKHDLNSKSQFNNLNENKIQVSNSGGTNITTNVIYNKENFNSDIGGDVKNVQEIEKNLARKYKNKIRISFILTILMLLIDAYSNIDTFYNLKPRFLDTQFVLYNNSFLVNEKHIIFIDPSFTGYALKNGKIISVVNEERKKGVDAANNSSLKFLSENNSTYNFYSDKSIDLKDTINNSNNINSSDISNYPWNDTYLKSISSTNKLNNSNENFILSNLAEIASISINYDAFNITHCKKYSRSDLEKIEFIYYFSAIRYSLLLINTILDIFIMLMTTASFVYKVELNKLYSTRFVIILLFLLNKCWSMCAVAYSYFDFLYSDCLNSINAFDVFFYAYLSYVFLLFFLILLLLIYALFCRQLLFYILIIFVSALTLFIAPIMCMEKLQKSFEKIHKSQEFKIKDDLEAIKKLQFKRKEQNIQLWLGYIVFFFIFLTGISAILNFAILKYIWITDSIRMFVPAISSLFTIFLSLFEKIFVLK